MNIFTGKWNEIVSGAVIALFFIITLYILNTPIGLSNSYLMLSEYCQDVIHAEKIIEPDFWNWETGFLFGILLGGLIASLVDKVWQFCIFPEERQTKEILPSAALTPLLGIVGGFLVMLGLQLAGDSFMGQWAAALQLSTGAWLFITLTFLFASGILYLANRINK